MIVFTLTMVAVAFLGTDRLALALEKAGDNRSELETVLQQYPEGSQKHTAVCFLIENMAGYYYTALIFFDPDDVRVAFDALSYENYDAASSAMSAIEKERGELHYGKGEVDGDHEERPFTIEDGEIVHW